MRRKGGCVDEDGRQVSGNDAGSAARSLRFQQLALPHLDAAYNLARWLCGNSLDADDIVQEAFMRALRFFDSFRGDSARPWLLAIVRHTWYDEWRRRASAPEVAAYDDERDAVAPDGWGVGIDDPQTLLIRAEDARLVHAALERLPAAYREVLVLREMEELSYRAIAAIAGVPVGTVMSRLARARAKLAGALAGVRANEARLAGSCASGAGGGASEAVDGL
ncbi:MULTISPECIES: RNA polymerase sigma factor [Burkholderia]|uniref:RNA polymerase sigma factor n=1 Tax=Burkholderia TaxID=32008 RepID=UPI0035B5DDB7